MSQGTLADLPGGLGRTVSGGTRTQLKYGRPWQVEVEFSHEGCPFCKSATEEGELFLPGMPDGWRLLRNKFTPLKRHHLAIPKTSWEAEKLQRLGGKDGIREALEVVRLAIERNAVEMAGYIHVGFHGGQNLAHPHWHILEPQVRSPLVLRSLPSELLVHRFGKFSIYAAGVRAGECLILSETKLRFGESLDVLSNMLYWMVERGNEKFPNAQGLPPEFSVSVRVAADGNFRYAAYCPILNMWGASETVFAPLEDGPYTLPWTHESTAAHLRGD